MSSRQLRSGKFPQFRQKILRCSAKRADVWGGPPAPVPGRSLVRSTCRSFLSSENALFSAKMKFREFISPAQHPPNVHYSSSCFYPQFQRKMKFLVFINVEDWHFIMLSHWGRSGRPAAARPPHRARARARPGRGATEAHAARARSRLHRGTVRSPAA